MKEENFQKSIKLEIPQWQYDEMKLYGVKFDSEEFADKYDEHHLKFRDYQKETEERIKLLALDRESAIIDMGCGTGAFAIHAAGYFSKIYAVDVSQLMINHARKKANEIGIDNVEFHHAGFLTYKHQDEPVNGIVSTLALHHLPDFWKLIALKKLVQMLKPGGRFLLADVVFSFDATDYEANIKRFIQTMTDRMGAEMKQELETHFRQEYSIFDWIMEEMLEKAGFTIKKADYREGFFATYLCEKKAE
jgi:putative AdoMet-dependent methyltransferase